VLVLEIVVDAVLLHQARYERQIALAILHAILDLVVLPGGAILEIRAAGKSRVGENLRDDFLDVLVEKDPAIGTVTKQPQPRSQHQSVVRIFALLANFAAGPLR